MSPQYIDGYVIYVEHPPACGRLVCRMEAMGVDRVVFGLPSERRDTVLPIIDECAKFI